MTDTPAVPTPDEATAAAASQPDASQPGAVPPAVPAQPSSYATQPYTGQQTYAPQPAGYGGYAPPTNTLAIIALVGAFVVPLVGIICGHLALGQIKRTGEGGRSLALAGLILGYSFTALIVLIIVFSFAVPLFVLAIVGSAGGFS